MKMKNKRLLSGVIILVAVSLALVSAMTVSAAEPNTQAFHDENSGVVADCGGFLALADYEIDGRATTFFDNDGNPLRVQAHAVYNGTLTNSVTGLILRDPSRLTLTASLQEGTTTQAGLAFAITVPGEGIAMLDVGRLVFDAEGNVIFEGGPHQFLDEGDSLICAALD
jgi:hypothetical protein